MRRGATGVKVLKESKLFDNPGPDATPVRSHHLALPSSPPVGAIPSVGTSPDAPQLQGVAHATPLAFDAPDRPRHGSPQSEPRRHRPHRPKEPRHARTPPPAPPRRGRARRPRPGRRSPRHRRCGARERGARLAHAPRQPACRASADSAHTSRRPPPRWRGAQAVTASKRFDHGQREAGADVHQPGGEAGGARREGGGRVRLGEPGHPHEALQARVPGERGEPGGVRDRVLHADHMGAVVGPFGEPRPGEERCRGGRGRGPRPVRALPRRSPGGSRPGPPRPHTGARAGGPSPFRPRPRGRAGRRPRRWARRGPRRRGPRPAPPPAPRWSR